jgi:phage-related protein
VNENKRFRTVIVYKDYFEKFFNKQKQKVKDKIIWTFNLIEEVNHVPETYLKHIEGTKGLYEIRVQQGSNIYRILCFFDDNKLVVVANAFEKKSVKAPKEEINKALKIKEEYYEEKKHQNS